jgi:hypothetical protein
MCFICFKKVAALILPYVLGEPKVCSRCNDNLEEEIAKSES